MNEQFVPSTWMRLFANIIDGLIGAILVVASMNGYLAALLAKQDYVVRWPFVAAILVFFAVYQVGLLKFQGATLGKMATGLKVVDLVSGGPLSWSQAATRGLGTIIFGAALGSLHHAVLLFRADRRQLLDLMANTRVVQKTPREKEPKPRVVLGVLMVIVGLFSIGSNLAQMSSNYDWNKEGIIIHAPVYK